MKLHTPTDIYGAIKPLYYTSKILGLAPFSDINSESLTERLSNLWSVVMMVLQVAGMVFGMLQIESDLRKGGTETSYIATSFLVIFLMHFTSVAVTVLGSTLYRHNIPIILKKITEVDHVLFPFTIGRNVMYKKTFRILLTEIVMLALALGSVHSYYRYFTGTYIPTASVVFDTISDVTNTIMDAVILNVVILLNHRCRTVNRELKKELLTLTDVHLDCRSIKPCSDSPCDMSIVEEMSNRNATRMTKTLIYERTLRRAPSIICSQADRIHNLREVYTRLYDISKLLNATYGFPLLLDIAYNFINTIVSVYYVLRDAMDLAKDEFGTSGLIQMTSRFCWGTANLGKIVIMTALCHYASSEAQDLSVVVQKLLLSQLLRPGVKTELQLFGMQLANGKVQFTAFGFFYVDLTLLCAMIGSATTYIIVLVQFRENPLTEGGTNSTNTANDTLTLTTSL